MDLSFSAEYEAFRQEVRTFVKDNWTDDDRASAPPPNPRSMMLGALIRTAECAGVHGVLIAKHHAASISPAVVRASAGASEHMPVAKVTNVAVCLDRLKEEGLWIVGAAAEGDRLFTEVDYSTPVALVIGSEGKGIRKLVRQKCDFLVKIPLYGKVASLNASVAGALLMYEVVRKRKKIG